MCYLAAKGGRRPRGELADLFWPKSEERSARTDLRSILTSLRKTLEQGAARGHGGGEGIGLLAIEGDLLGVEARGVELDLRSLEAAVSLARRETPDTSPMGGGAEAAVRRRGAIASLEGAREAYRGEFMEGFSLGDAPEFELWLEAERARWRGVFGELCERLSQLQVETGRLEVATETARLWVRHAPYEEAAHSRLVEILSAAGDPEGAILVYEGFRSGLRRELGIDPSPRMTKLAGGLREEVEERRSLGSILARSAAAPLSRLEVPFAGRRDEFGALVSEYHATRAGETRAVAVIGEPGIGKTRLAEEFIVWTRARGADVLQGAASEGAGLPYGPLLEAIRPRMERERAPDDLLEDAWLSELSRLLPELKERYPDLPSAPSGEGETAKGALFEAIVRTVEALASRAPVVFFLDDLQWADATTLEVLDYAGGRWAERGAPVLMLLAARAEEPESGSPLDGWLHALQRRLPLGRLALGPLENEDVARMLRRMAKPDYTQTGSSEGPGERMGDSDRTRSELDRLGEWLTAETRGQPFYFVETLKALLEEGKLMVRAIPDGGDVLEISSALRAEDASTAILPQSVREVIRSRLARLSPSAAALLVAGAVLGRGFGFEPLVGVANLDEAEGFRGLDELVGRRLFVEEAGGRVEEWAFPYPEATYSFSHEKIRQVAYTEGGQARRRILHRRAFGVLEARGAPPAELVRHALAAGLAKEAFTYSMAAGDAAAEVFAVRGAIARYEQARELFAAARRRGGTVEPSIQDVRRLHTQLGRAYEMADEWGKARVAYEAMLAFAREVGEARLEVVALNHLASHLYHHENNTEKAAALLEEARQVAEEAGLEEALAETECNLVDVAGLWTGQFERYRPLAEKALASARALERPDLVARTLTGLARVNTFAGRLGEAAAHAEEGANVSRELAERPAPARGELPSMLAAITGVSASWRAGAKVMELRCLIFLANIRIFQGRPREALPVAREAQEIAREIPGRTEALSQWAIARWLLDAGEYEQTLALTRSALEQARKTRNSYLLGGNLSRLGDIYEALQNPAEARAAFEEAAGRQHYKAWSYARLCVLAAVSGDWQEAHAQARKAYEAGIFFNPLFSVDLHREIEALVRGGDERLAREEVSRFAERARTNRRDRMSHLRALAVLSEWEGDTEGALGRLREAGALAEEIGLPGELWQIRERIGELYDRRGERGEAREAYSRAARILRDLAAKIKGDALREGFLAAPRVRRILDLG